MLMIRAWTMVYAAGQLPLRRAVGEDTRPRREHTMRIAGTGAAS